MYAYLFIFLFTIGAGTAATVGLMNVNNKSHETSKALEDVRIMSLWETNIGDALEFAGPSGELVPPLGVNVSGKLNAQLPPSWIVAPRTNAYGKAILYCPLSKNSTLYDSAPTQIIANQGNDYRVNTVVYKNKEYAIASNIALDKSIPRTSALAFIISPGLDETPTCNDVLYNADKGYFYLKGNVGIVRVITPAHKINHGVEETPNSNEPKDLSVIINDWGKTTGKDLIIDVSKDDYFNKSVSVTKFDSNNAIILRSLSGSKVSIKSNGANLSLNGVKILVENVNVANLGSISVENGVLTTNNAALPKTAGGNSSIVGYGDLDINGGFSAINSNINFNNTKVNVSTSGETAFFKNSRINAYNNATLSIDVKNGKIPLSLIGNTDLYLESSTLNLRGTSGYSDAMITNDAASRISLSSSTINLNSRSTYGIYTQGLVKLENSAIYPNSASTAGIYISDGSKAHIDGSSIGSSSKKFGYGIVIDSSSYTSGNNNNIYSTYTCVSGTGYNASRNMPEKAILNIQWTCR